MPFLAFHSALFTAEIAETAEKDFFFSTKEAFFSASSAVKP
jgi:hypothetical protein